MTESRVGILNYYRRCLEEEIAWRARVTLGTRYTRYLVPSLSREWIFSGRSEVSARINQSREAFVKELQQTKSSRGLFYGYPLFFMKGEGGRRSALIPILLFQLSWRKERGTIVFSLTNERPALNEDFLNTAFTTAEERSAFAEAMELDLWEKVDAQSFIRNVCNGIHDALDPIIVDVLDPENVRRDADVSSFAESGIYNKAAILFAEKQRINASVVRELEFLASDRVADEFAASSAGTFFGGPTPEIERRARGLARVCLLNDEQKTAVEASFSNNLTVVTGPPGTGKSQTILAILANSFLRGERVIFTSRNNRAVDVVEERLNRLAAAPIAMRVGAGGAERGGRGALVEFLTDVLTAAYSQERRDEYERAKSAFFNLQQGLFVKRIGADVAMQQMDRRIAEIESRYGIVTLEEAPLDEDLGRMMSAMAEIARDRAQDGRSWLAKLRDFKASRRDALWFERQAQVLLALWPGLEFPKGSVLGGLGWGEWAHFLERAGDLAAVARERALLIDRRAQARARAEEDAPGELGALEEMRLAEAASNFIRASVRSIPDRLDEESRKVLGEYRAALSRLEEGGISPAARSAIMAEIMRHFARISKILPIWCVTNLSVRNHIPLQAGLFERAVIDEASQCDIASAIPVLYRARTATIIGDPHQLRHVSRLSSARSQAIASAEGLAIEKATLYDYQQNSLFDLATACSREKPIFLKEHFRSHPDIVAFSNARWYHGRLNVRTQVQSLLTPPGYRPGVSWIASQGETVKAAAGGAYNKSEASLAARVAQEIMRDGSYRGSIGIVTPFRAQANLIVELLRDRMSLDTIERHDLVVDTVHGFQGDERDVVIFSTCLAGDMPESALFFLSRTENLFNVALTRPRALLIVLGEHGEASRLDISHIADFAKMANDAGWVVR